MNQDLKWLVDVLQEAADALRNSVPMHCNQQTSISHNNAAGAVNRAIGRLDPDSYQAKVMGHATLSQE